jgi:hypothetical protein
MSQAKLSGGCFYRDLEYLPGLPLNKQYSAGAFGKPAAHCRPDLSFTGLAAGGFGCQEEKKAAGCFSV